MIKLNRTLVSALTIAATLSVTACALTSQDNTYHGQKETNSTVGGSAVGALAGATIAGVATAGAGTVVGAAIGGGVAGGATGYVWDKDDAAIRAKMRAAGVRVVEVGYSNDIVLIMPSNVQFTPGNVALTPRFGQMLDAVAEVMKEYKYTVADVIGNSDSIGSAKYNMNLSLARAQTVADYLASQGVAANRLIPQGYGEMRPVASNKNAKGRADNRNVQIVLFAPPIRK